MAERRHNLPAQPTPLIGREREVRAACDLLLRDEVRLTTLTGPGGTGKTRVSIAVAAALVDAFPDGVVFVGLAPIADPDLVVPTIAQAVGLRDVGSRPVLETLTEHLRERRLLLLPDNLEQVLPAAPAIAELLAACPDLKILATSRAPLHLRGEHELPVPPLPLPDPGRSSFADELSNNPAVRLFVQRATEVRPAFALTDENAPTVAEICRRLDGLPLAIELAAARVKLLSPQALLSRLDHRLPLLTGGPRDLPERQRTLRDTIAWSYDHLDDEEERRLFRSLSVFVGGFTLGTGSWVIGHRDTEGLSSSPITHPLRGGNIGYADILSPSTLDLVASLVDKGLLRQEDGPDGEPRFAMLETIREFALELLVASGEEIAVRRSHLAWFADLAERGQVGLHGPESVTWSDRLAADLDNLRAALAWSLSDPVRSSIQDGLQAAATLFTFWAFRDQLEEGHRWLERALAANLEHHQPSGQGDSERRTPDRSAEPEGTAAYPGIIGTHVRVAALIAAGQLALFLGRLESATASAEQALALARQVGEQIGEAHALIVLANIGRGRGEHEHAAELLAESLSIARSLNHRYTIWRALTNLGEALTFLGDYERARTVLEEGLDVARSAGHGWGVGTILRLLGGAAFSTGDLDRAATLLEESLVWWAKVRSTRGAHLALLNLGRVHLAREQPGRAVTCFADGLALSRASGDRRHLAADLEGLAGAALASVDRSPSSRSVAAAAARILGMAATVRAAIGTPLWPAERATLDRAVMTAREILGDEAYEAALAEGGRLSTPEAIELGLELAQQIGAVTQDETSSDASAPHPMRGGTGRGAALTARERAVATLIGRGYSNRRIAEQLVIAEKTAEVHARRVREKLGLDSRAQIAAWAAQHGLLTP